VMSREEAEAASRSAFLTEHIHDLDSAMRGLEDAQLALAVATGRLTEEQAKLIAIEDQTSRALQDFEKSQEKERQTANDAYFAAERRLRQLDILPGFLKTAADYYGGYTSAEQESLWTIKELDKKEGEYQDTLVDTQAALKATVVATDAKKKQDEAGKKAKDAGTKSLKEWNDEIEREQKLAEANRKTYDDAISQLNALEAADEKATQTKS